MESLLEPIGIQDYMKGWMPGYAYLAARQVAKSRE